MFHWPYEVIQSVFRAMNTTILPISHLARGGSCSSCSRCRRHLLLRCCSAEGGDARRRCNRICSRLDAAARSGDSRTAAKARLVGGSSSWRGGRSTTVSSGGRGGRRLGDRPIERAVKRAVGRRLELLFFS